MSKSLFDPSRSFQPITLGRAVELALVVLGNDPDSSQVDALIQIIAGITDEKGCGERHCVAAELMRFVHALRTDDWVTRATTLQMKSNQEVRHYEQTNS
jgi:hypothetical protein